MFDHFLFELVTILLVLNRLLLLSILINFFYFLLSNILNSRHVLRSFITTVNVAKPITFVLSSLPIINLFDLFKYHDNVVVSKEQVRNLAMMGLSIIEDLELFLELKVLQK